MPRNPLADKTWQTCEFVVQHHANMLHNEEAWSGADKWNERKETETTTRFPITTTTSGGFWAASLPCGGLGTVPKGMPHNPAPIQATPTCASHGHGHMTISIATATVMAICKCEETCARAVRKRNIQWIWHRHSTLQLCCKSQWFLSCARSWRCMAHAGGLPSSWGSAQ